MSAANDNESESVVTVARAVRTRGLKGELVAELLTDFPERFEEIDELIATSPEGQRSVLKLESFWLQNGRVILKIGGCDRIETAAALVGYEFSVPESERVALPQDHFYDWELEGCRVELRNGSYVGEVKSVMRTGGPVILNLVGEGREYLVPLAEDIAIKIEPAQKKIVIDPPEGLLDL